MRFCFVIIRRFLSIAGDVFCSVLTVFRNLCEDRAPEKKDDVENFRSFSFSMRIVRIEGS